MEGMHEAKERLDEMITAAEAAEKTTLGKLETLKSQQITLAWMAKWNDLTIRLQCDNERLRTLYEVRGKLGI